MINMMINMMINKISNLFNYTLRDFLYNLEISFDFFKCIISQLAQQEKSKNSIAIHVPHAYEVTCRNGKIDRVNGTRITLASRNQYARVVFYPIRHLLHSCLPYTVSAHVK